ncbi:MAG: hypothetical protein ACLFOY_15855 [Desulfatibacillaceae bacterium]
MKDMTSMLRKIQEQADCHATTDPLRELSDIESEPDRQQVAPKWLALAALHGVNANAKWISLGTDENGDVTVVAKYRKSELPAPSEETAENVFNTVREVGHFDKETGRIPVSLGIRDSTVDIDFELEKEKGGERLTMKFRKEK